MILLTISYKYVSLLLWLSIMQLSQSGRISAERRVVGRLHRWSLNDSCSCYSCPVYDPPTCQQGEPSDPFLMNQIQQRWRDSNAKTRLKSDHLLAHLSLVFLLACLLCWSRLLCCEVRWREVQEAMNWGWPLRSRGRKTKALTPANNLVSRLGSRSLLSWTLQGPWSWLTSWLQLEHPA